MAYLIQHLLLPLLIVALFAAVAGWCWHCLRNRDRAEKLIAQRNQLRQQLAAMGPSPAPAPALRGLMPDPELEAAQMRADVAVSKVVEMERLQADMLLERDRLSARANELEMALAAARAASEGADWSTRFSALEDERDAALRELDEARQAWKSERESLVAAAPAPQLAAPAADLTPSLEARAQNWRLKLLEGRTAYLESRLEAARASVASPLPDTAERDAQSEALAAENARLVSRLVELENRPAPAPVMVAAPAQRDESANLLRWQARYLGERVKYLESVARAPVSAAVEAAPVVASEPAPEDAEVELRNRRAWRQRYLEARLAYYEGRWREDRAGRAAATQESSTRLARLEALERELSEARGALDDRQARLLSLEAMASAHREKADMATASLSAVQAEVDALRAKLDASRTTAESVRALEAEKARLEAVLAEREADLARLKDLPQPAQPIDPSEMLHLRFRARYLDDRVKFLEARLAAQPAARAPATPAPQTFMPSEPSDAEVRPLSLPAARGGAPDDLRLIDGVSPRLESALHSMGVYHFDQIASWTPQNVAWIERFFSYKGRITRERWVEQAQALARGDDYDARRRYREDEPV